MRLGAAAAVLLRPSWRPFAIGCGGEREFDAGEFIDAANEKGAELALGEQITTTPAGEPVYAVRFAAAPGDEPNPQLQSGA